jgi:sulfur carrier protein ThiS adenylyltransferase
MSTAASTISYADRDVRQRQIVPADKLAACHAMVIGVGAIGRQVALQLAAMGIGRMDLYDHDTVGVENLACQGYLQRDVGLSKVIATDHLCQQINPEVHLTFHSKRFRRSSLSRLMNLAPDQPLAVSCCVDSIDTAARKTSNTSRHCSLPRRRMSAPARPRARSTPHQSPPV